MFVYSSYAVFSFWCISNGTNSHFAHLLKSVFFFISNQFDSSTNLLAFCSLWWFKIYQQYSSCIYLCDSVQWYNQNNKRILKYFFFIIFCFCRFKHSYYQRQNVLAYYGFKHMNMNTRSIWKTNKKWGYIWFSKFSLACGSCIKPEIHLLKSCCNGQLIGKTDALVWQEMYCYWKKRKCYVPLLLRHTEITNTLSY